MPKCQIKAAFYHHYTIFYSAQFNIRNDAFIEIGNKSPDNGQGTGCGDCVDILVEIVTNIELTESKLSHPIYFKRLLRKETYILSCKGMIVQRHISKK